MDTPSTGLRLRVDVDGLQIIAPQRRRWWQLWKPKQWMQVMAEVTYPVHPNARVTLLQAGAEYIATVNGAPVLTWQPPA